MLENLTYRVRNVIFKIYYIFIDHVEFSKLLIKSKRRGTSVGFIWWQYQPEISHMKLRREKNVEHIRTSIWEAIWEASGASGRQVEDIWEPSGRHLVAIWEASGSASGGIGSSRWPEMTVKEKCVKTIVFYCRKWRDRPSRLHGSDVTCTKYCK